ncbi:IclR family transcriptional regulator [Pseudonocardia endophytica]|uniref:IclR family transcriptional regulator n=1 Tax=Pseudonocardia endophytica TaxID=401976 RepID=UPI001FB38005|nr:IclR family transcriptional regulator [Pseudonocardia endophytica]
MLALLGAFRPEEPEVTLTELCRRTDLPKPTGHRLLAELESQAMVERTARGYRLGIRLFELGQLVPGQRDLQETAAPFLADLHRATGETVHLAVLDGAEVVYLQKLTTSGGPQIASRTGGRMPAHVTAVGKALLAYGTASQVEVVLDAGLARVAPRSIVLPARLGAELARVRHSGVAEEHEESGVGVACVAAPVLGADGRAIAGLSITGWSNRLNTERVAPAVRTAALALSRALGG